VVSTGAGFARSSHQSRAIVTASLGINTCFAVKRWPHPEDWAEIVRHELGLDLVQHSFDLVELNAPEALVGQQADGVRSACEGSGLTLHSTFTGLAAYSSNLLLHPEPSLRRRAESWFQQAIAFTARAGGRATGGHVGAYTVRSWRDEASRIALGAALRASLRRLAQVARRAGLEELYIENLASAREPSTMQGVEELLTEGDDAHVPVKLCLDVGHQCVSGTSGDDRDPYAWLRHFGARAPIVQLQQSDSEGDHHWPFTEEFNVRGRIDATKVLKALAASGAESTVLVLEVIPPFEQDDDDVLADIKKSVRYWSSAMSAFAAPSVV
jgi:sugar phosphate isomerase/epimerase